MWAWADIHHANALRDRNRERSPVLRPEFESNVVLVPPDTSIANEIVAAIHPRHRHRWFRSLRSSQALTQSVFGALRVHGRLDLLLNVVAECGRPAFLNGALDASLVLEHRVSALQEPRPTQVDAFLESPSGRVAIECKLMERDFGRCSRPRLKPYQEQYCDGDYRAQHGRSERCALTHIDIMYWTYLPSLFTWDSDRDMSPCPLYGVYQLARNALAATVTADGIDPASGHVLVVYDSRNPEFAAGGEAHRQYLAAEEASRVPGLIRRLSWQRLSTVLVAAPELDYLRIGLERMYGIRPE